MDRKVYASLRRVVNYLHADERKHWEESGNPKEHIYYDIHRLAEWLDDNSREKI